MKPTRQVWWVYSACAVAVAVAMAWVTVVVVRLERAQDDAYSDADHQTAMRLALWRMDSWMAPLLAREAARPHYEYQAYYPQQKAYTRVLGEIEPGEVLTPSPLLAFRSKLFELHFQCDDLSVLTSPQVPTGNWRDLAEGSSPEQLIDPRPLAALEALRPLVRTAKLATHCERAEALLPGPGCEVEFPPQPGPLDISNRAQVYNTTQQAAVPSSQWLNTDTAQVALGPLVPIWLDSDSATPRLAFVRRVRAGGTTRYQGVLANWPRLREALLAQIADLFPGGDARIAPQPEPPRESEGRLLATVPAQLSATPPVAPRPAWSTTRSVLAGAWLAMALAVVAVGFTLRSTVALGERRAQFASVVTHELRTPLTTFRMYSEMLADDMVRDPAQRATYLETLRGEADRLSRLVENVLCYSRLEEGRYRGRRERLTLRELLGRVTPTLERRTADAGMQLCTVVEDGDRTLETDPDAVAQILFNLVDNACKYAAESTPPTVELRVTASPGGARVTVRDHGPGIATEHARAVFRPFERGARAAGDNDPPGVGLGLALARGLARDLGGRLEIDGAVQPGARFVLELC